MRRTFALIVALTFLLGSVGVQAAEIAPGGTFWDDDGNIHEPQIEAIAAANITFGCGGDRYCPSESVTRGQMAAFLKRAFLFAERARPVHGRRHFYCSMPTSTPSPPPELPSDAPPTASVPTDP